MKFVSSDERHRRAIQASRVLLDGVEQDISDLRVVDTERGFIVGLERPVRLVDVMGHRELATWEKRGKVEVLPR